MFVYEVRENAGFDGILDRVLVKDDEHSLEKVKQTLIQMLESTGDLLAIPHIKDVKGITELEDFHSFELMYYNLESEKIEVI